jgi:hypothetical protein
MALVLFSTPVIPKLITKERISQLPPCKGIVSPRNQRKNMRTGLNLNLNLGWKRARRKIKRFCKISLKY